LYSHVNTVVTTTRAENGNGYALLWEVLALSVPGFDPTLHVSAPVWEDFMDIMAFGQAHILYFRLQAKLGLYYDDRCKSSTFLRSVQHTEFVDVCTILQTHIETFLDPYEEGYLPPHLCLMGLAQRIDKNRQSRVRGDLLPRARRMQGLSWMTVIRFVIIRFWAGIVVSVVVPQLVSGVSMDAGPCAW